MKVPYNLITSHHISVIPRMVNPFSASETVSSAARPEGLGKVEQPLPKAPCWYLSCVTGT